jgi:hypothetical protein
MTEVLNLLSFWYTLVSEVMNLSGKYLLIEAKQSHKHS